MPLITLDNVSLAFGHVALLDKVGLQIEPGERVCLVGRNGEGKSTLMRLIRGEVSPDDGSVWRQPDMRIAMLQQEVPQADAQTVFDIIAGGLQQTGALITEYHHVAQQLEHAADDALLQRLGELQQALEASDGWRLEQRVEAVITRLNLPMDIPLAQLSGGYKRRVLLGRALVSEPDLLLLDEPTNHLDIEGIQWLEDFLREFNGALLFITHDRSFLQHLATRIIELDRGQLSSWPGDYGHYLEKKQHQLEVEAEHNARFDKKLAQEEGWIRQGIKARRTRNEGRVRALEALRRQKSQRREVQSTVKLKLDSGDISGKLVADVENISFRYEGKMLVENFSTRIVRGDRIGIIGPNGAGKSTLLKLMLGQLQPNSGSVKLGTNLQIAYFDQQRAQLDPEKSVIDNLNQGSDTVTINGKTKHVMGYLQDFLFPPQRARSPVKSLSGGERNRLLLAQLFCRPANLLVMDEPTNDLDVETLELLEELLLTFDGTLLLVSHDRTFLDNVVTSTLVFEGQGHVAEYVGGYEDWQRQIKDRPVQNNVSANAVSVSASTSPERVSSKANGKGNTSNTSTEKTKLSYKEQQELAALPHAIERLESEKVELEQCMAQSGFYQQGKDDITRTMQRLEAVTGELEHAYSRWEYLEGCLIS